MFGGAQANFVDGNVLAGNGNQGISIPDAGTATTIVQGNAIGVDATGALAIANGYAGVEFYGGAHGNLVGGLAPVTAMSFPATPARASPSAARARTAMSSRAIPIGLNRAGTAVLSNAWAGCGYF